MQESQDSRGPWSFKSKAAFIPPQPQCPVTMMSVTFKTSTAYWTTASTLISEGGAWLAMLRCTKTSPAWSPKIQLAGTRESEHPIHRYSGLCTSAKSSKKLGSSSTITFAHILLLAIILWKLSMMTDSDRKSIGMSQCDLRFIILFFRLAGEVSLFQGDEGEGTIVIISFEGEFSSELWCLVDINRSY